MKTFGTLLMLVALLVLPALAAGSELGSLRIGLIEGDVQISTEDTQDWMPASGNMPLREGDRIWVPGNGRVEIQSRDGSYIRLDRDTSLDVLRIEDKGYQFGLNSGRAYVSFFEDRGSMIQVDSPIASVRLNQRARAKIDVSAGGGTDISMLKGTALVEDRRGEIEARQGELLSLKPDLEGRVFDLPSPDAWERWNTQRDRRLYERSASSRYLPEDLRTYSSDFDENGRWVEDREYGWVWTPRTYIVADWAPYHYGRWVWIGGDYVWISHEPWGWAPYHYGRWSHRPHIGWFWVPPRRGDIFWSPGYVAWVHTPHHVSWVPLAPGEVYYGRGHYGHHSVNVTNINVVINRPINVYRNVHVHNAVRHVHRDSFHKGVYRDVRIDKQVFINEKVHPGRPRIEPTRETRMPMIKQIDASRRPPAAVQQTRPERIKQERHLVKDRNRSVFAPDKRPERQKLIERKPAETGPRDRHVGPKDNDRPKVRERKELQPQERQRTDQRGGIGSPRSEEKRDLKPADRGKADQGGIRQRDRMTDRPTAPEHKIAPSRKPDEKQPAAPGREFRSTPDDRARPNVDERVQRRTERLQRKEQEDTRKGREFREPVRERPAPARVEERKPAKANEPLKEQKQEKQDRQDRQDRRDDSGQRQPGRR